jgi:hypothetical protein
MFQSLVSHNPDLARLVEKGYAVALDVSNHLVVRDIPYLDSDGVLCWGAFVAKLVFTDQFHVTQDDHQIYFAGSTPYELTGRPVGNLGGGAISIQLSYACADVHVERAFSNKPRVNGDLAGFDDFFAKVESYVAIVCGPAMSRYGVSPLTFRAVPDDVADPIFKFRDTLTSKAEVGELASKFEDEVVAIIGLGGTGSYVLDFLVKTRVREIRGFDGDYFHVHNAYRAPGKTIVEEFNTPKAHVLQGRYENFRHGLVLQPKYIDETSVEEFDGVTFVFVCVDKGSSRARIFDLLIAARIPFVDVGMGLRKKPGGLSGSMRVTQFLPERAGAVRARGYAAEADEPENVYRANIQISELNALNASLAVIKYKQLRGFYRADIPADDHIFNVAEMKTYQEGVE